MMSTLAIMMGLPRSGKSTVCKDMMNKDYVIVCPDKIRLALHGKAFERLAEQFVWASAELMVRTLLMQGHSVLVDATNVSRFSRRRWVDMAREFDLTLLIFYVNTSKEVCLERNTGEGAVPPEVIATMSKNFQYPDPSEGTVIKAGSEHTNGH